MFRATLRPKDLTLSIDEDAGVVLRPLNVSFTTFNTHDGKWSLLDSSGSTVLTRADEGWFVLRDDEAVERFGDTSEDVRLWLGLEPEIQVSIVRECFFWIFYSALWLALTGSTPGKLILGLWVRDPLSSTNRVRWWVGLLRGAFQVAGLCMCFFGWLWALSNPRRQTWHDKIAQTEVVRQ